MFRKIAFGTLILIGISIGFPAQSASFTTCGPTICYEYDDAQPAIGPGDDTFGTPIRIGDDMVFVPTNFRAESSDGTGNEIASSNFIFSAIYTVNSNLEIGNITVTESGDYNIINGDSVGVDLRLQVVNLSVFELFVQTTTFDASGDSGGQQEWELTNSLDPSAEFTFNANSINLGIQNTLEARTDADLENAWIQKKLTLSVVAVPIPAAVWLFGSGLGLLGWFRRRQTP